MEPMGLAGLWEAASFNAPNQNPSTMSQVQSATVSTTDPRYPSDQGSVTKTTVRKGDGDTVTVDAGEDGDDSRGMAMIVLLVNCDGRASAAVQRDGSVLLTASGSGIVEFLELELTTSDPNNWSVTVHT